MPELEDQLTALAASIEWPPTPQLRIVRTIRLFDESAPRIVRTNRRFALAAAAALLIVATTLLAYTPTRDAIAGWLNLHTNIQRVKNLPTPSPLPSGRLGSNLALGTPATLTDAQHQVSWKIILPTSLGQPDAVYVKPASEGGPSLGEVTLVYAERPNIKVSGPTGVAVLVTEARGAVNEIFFQKMVGPDTTIEQVTVKGHAGYWLSGHPHAFAFTDANGNFHDEQLRLATNTLVLDENGTIVRIEGDLTKAQAVEIAGSLT